MTALTKPELLSVADYLEGEEFSNLKHEYLGGVIHAMAGASNAHNTISLNLAATLHSNLRGKPCRPFHSDTKVRITLPDQIRFYYPDVMVVCQPNPPTDHFQDMPVVLVEVLSESTRRTDLVEKFEACLTIPSLKVLIFVESDQASVTLHRRQNSGGFLRETYQNLHDSIALPEIETAISLKEIYESVEFESASSTPA